PDSSPPTLLSSFSLHDALPISLLSPFDNLIADRARTEQLFSYRYRTEIYTPPHLRKLGYWAMPVLHGDRIVGSVDPRFERARGEDRKSTRLNSSHQIISYAVFC